MAGRFLNLSNTSLSRSLERLSSGLRVNRAGDDAAGLAVSEKLRARISGLGVDVENAQAGVSIVQTADQALQEVQAMVRRIRSLALMCGNGTLTDGDREHYQSEVGALLTEIDRINSTTEYNGMRILGGKIGTQAWEAEDERDILDSSSIRATDDLVTKGVYNVEVLRVAEQASGRLEGKVFDFNDPPLTITEAGGMYRFSGAAQDDVATVKIELDGKIIFVDLDLTENAGDSISSALTKINQALEEAGMDAHATFKPPNSPSDIVIDSISGIIQEDIEATVPVAWQNPAPLNWAEAGPKIYDPTGAARSDTIYTLDFTSPTDFTITGNVSGSLGAGTTGTNFVGGGISFTVQPNGNYTAGDRIELTANSNARSVTVTTGGVTGISGGAVPTDSIIPDAAHTVEVENTSYVDSSSNTGVAGYANITGVDTSGLQGDAIILNTDTTGVVGEAPKVTSIDDSGVSPGGGVTWLGGTPTIEAVNTIVSETFTLQMVTENGGTGDEWTVIGSVSGAHNDLTVGGAYTTNSVGGQGGGLTLEISPDAAYNVGDTITIDVAALTSVDWNLTPYVRKPTTIVNEDVTLKLVTDRDGLDTWSIDGSVSGQHSFYLADTGYATNEGTAGGGAGIGFYLDGNPCYEVNDTIVISTGVQTPAAIWQLAPYVRAGGNTLVTETFTLENVTDREGSDTWAVTGSVTGVNTFYLAGTGHATREGSNGGGAGLGFYIRNDALFARGDIITVDVEVQKPPFTWSVGPTAEVANTLLDEDITLRCISDPGSTNDVWQVTGSISGDHGTYTSNSTITTGEGSNGGGAGLTFNLDGHIDYQVGDEITITTKYGRRARLNAGGWTTGITPNSSNVNMIDGGGNELAVNFGGTITGGNETITLDTNIAIDGQHPPDRIWDVPPNFPPSSSTVISQRYTLTMIADNDGPDEWSVTGNFSGVHVNAFSGTPYVSDNGTIGQGGGFSFTLAEDSKYAVGTTIGIDVYTRPSIVVTAGERGSAHEIYMEVLHGWNQTDLTALSSGYVNNGTTNEEIGLNTIIYDGDANPFDDLDFAEGIVQITNRAGSTFNINVVNMETIQDLLDSINSASSTLYATFDQDTRSISIHDESGGEGRLTISDVGNATLAEDLGIRGVTSSDTLTGHRISRVADTILQITDPDGNTARVSSAWGNAGNHFAAANNTTAAVTDSGPDSMGGIAGISFNLNEKQLKVGDSFSILADRGTLRLHVSQATGDDTRAITEIGDTSTTALGIAENMNVYSQDTAQELIDSGRLDDALDSLSMLRGNLGAFQNRLEHTIKNLGVTQENLQTAESRIRDADMAAEQLDFMRHQIMQRFGIASMSQANVLAENVLRLVQ